MIKLVNNIQYNIKLLAIYFPNNKYVIEWNEAIVYLNYVNENEWVIFNTKI